MKDSDLLFGLMCSIHKPAYTYSDIEWLTAPFSISETCLRSTLSRMVGGGILHVEKEGRKAWYRFTPRADKLGSNVSLAFNSPDWSGWDDDWWGISISVPEAAKKTRYQLLKKLDHYRFASLHPGFWIRPYREAEKVESKLNDVLTHTYCKAIRFNFYDKSELKKIPGLWKIEAVNQSFKDCIRYLAKCYEEYDLDNPQEALRGKMIIGDILVKQLASDPLLPDQFLPPDWQGDKLREVFQEWMRITSMKSKSYWGRILNSSDNQDVLISYQHGKSYKLAP